MSKRNSLRQSAAPAPATVTVLPAEAFDLPRLSLTLTDELTWLTRFDERGRPGITYPVAPDDVAQAFTRTLESSGLLPENVLWWKKSGREQELAVWLPPARRTMRMGFNRGVQAISAPLPGFIFAGRGRSYSLWAVRARPDTAAAPLFNAPLPNVHPDGKVCAGTVDFPICTGETIYQAAALFWESEFNTDLDQARVRDAKSSIAFLRSLKRAAAFPLDRLLPARTQLAALLSGRAAGAAAFEFFEGDEGDE